MDGKVVEAVEMLVALRKRGFTQVKIARLLGCTQAAVSRWQNGVREPEGEWMVKLGGLWREKIGEY